MHQEATGQRDRYVVLCRRRDRPDDLLTVSGPYPDAAAAWRAAGAERSAELGWPAGDGDLVFEVAPLHADDRP